MQTYIRRLIDFVRKIETIVGQGFKFAKSVIAIPQSYNKAFLNPSVEIISVKSGMPGIYLIRSEYRQIKKLFSEI